MSTLAPPPERTLTTLFQRFGAGEPLACRPLTEGLLNRGYRVVTTRGRFFLKHHLDGDPEAVVPLARRHGITTALAALGLPVVPPVADREGRTVAVLGRGGSYALYPWVEGRHRGGGELTPDECRRLGALLGRVHRGLEHVITGAEDRAAGVRCAEAADAASTRELIEILLARIRLRSRRTGFDELAEHRLLERRELLLRHAHRRPHRAQMPASGWVHGDFHPLNLLYRREGPAEPVAIIDWDRLGIRPRAEEAVRAAAIFFLRPDGSLDLTRVRAYARAYRQATGAPGDELSAAVHRVWWERLNDFWMLRWHYELRDTRADPQFPAAAALIVWWTRYAAAVRSAFCD
ncbi:phosphotransferase [Streptomyces sp. ACA25]|uniref:phosphotransferase n=1 Tax=Streptomyces sp. ACA25 TaxID=3022596 RepID=UPI003FA76058